ncbi:pentapeptide repeat-containing protein [Argonema antarcticum]|uniref:pentapeptide repeat-containing protein n=1 Tax=Argonema antarcticum TaxID=2942763 RepID=UPI0020120A96|nr:pentapeptide repeat-containing protein [Argonema antarcticum]MCL1472768.1 pentapeptide repeat-containing protein [Argonema antarcticum A004/B2]
MDAEELLRRYATGERDFTGVKLPGVRSIDKNLRGAIFREADLSNACLDWTNLSYADLSYANLKGARLGEAALQGANLEYADLSNAVFGQTSFSDANLSHANLRYAILTEASFFDGNLSYADLSGASGFSINRCQGATFCETIMPDGSIRTDSV